MMIEDAGEPKARASTELPEAQRLPCRALVRRAKPMAGPAQRVAV
ncbi:MAG: hypothetical protein ACM31N_00115 [Deltaproteobacteria bacterium]